MTQDTLHGASSSPIPESLLREIASVQPIDEIIQDVLLKWIRIPLILWVSMSTFDSVIARWNNQEWSVSLVNIPYVLDDTSGMADIDYPMDPTIWKPWYIHLQGSPRPIHKLQSDTRRQIEYVMRYSQELRRSEIIHKVGPVPRSLLFWKKALRYSDKDANVYFLYSHKINIWKNIDDTDLHESIRSISMDKDGTMYQYRVISSYQAGKWKDKNIILIAIEVDMLDYFSLHGCDDHIWDNDLTYLSRCTQVFTLSVETLRKNIRESNFQE